MFFKLELLKVIVFVDGEILEILNFVVFVFVLQLIFGELDNFDSLEESNQV